MDFIRWVKTVCLTGITGTVFILIILIVNILGVIISVGFYLIVLFIIHKSIKSYYNYKQKQSEMNSYVIKDNITLIQNKSIKDYIELEKSESSTDIN